jgi:transposase
MLDAIPPIKRPLGRPRRRPAKLHTDKGYDAAHCRAACRERGVIPRIARRGIESSEKLGRYRWVVERTFAWLCQSRRLSKDYERLGETSEALIYLAMTRLMLRRLAPK